MRKTLKFQRALATATAQNKVPLNLKSNRRGVEWALKVCGFKLSSKNRRTMRRVIEATKDERSVGQPVYASSLPRKTRDTRDRKCAIKQQRRFVAAERPNPGDNWREQRLWLMASAA